jgi:hypothetical protein
MQTFAPGSETISTPELDHPPRYSGELPSVADAITILWAVDSQRDALAAQFGSTVISRLVGYAETDMRGVMHAGCEPLVERHLTQYLPDAELKEALRSGSGNRLEITSLEAYAWVYSGALTLDEEMAVDSLNVARYRPARLPLPLYSYVPVQVALALQAEQGSEDDRTRAAELQNRLPETGRVNGALANLATTGY